MHSIPFLLLALFLLPASAAGLPVQDPSHGPAAEQAPEEKPAISTEEGPVEFLRIVRNEDGQPMRLQTAVVRYVAPLPEDAEDDATPMVVDLISAIHVADRSYYKDLEELFAPYDALLYELVKEKGGPIPIGEPELSLDPIAMVLDMGLEMVHLSSQTDHIDYTKDNFIHADLSPTEILECMKNRGDSPLTVILDAATEFIRAGNLEDGRQDPEGDEAPELDLFSLMMDSDGPMQIKRYFAQQIVYDSKGPGLGKTLNTLLITDRNNACTKSLQKQLAKGRKKVGIFFGAAHMPDFDRRLREDFGLQRSETRWMTAWDLR